MTVWAFVLFVFLTDTKLRPLHQLAIHSVRVCALRVFVGMLQGIAGVCV